MHHGHRADVRLMGALVISVALTAACSSGGDSTGGQGPGSGATDATATSGGVCTQADARLVIAGVEHICMLETGKTLVWTPSVTPSGGGSIGEGEPSRGLASSADIPAVVENWGFDLQPFDPTTGMAGAMKITGATTPPADPNNPMDNRYLFIDYGDPGSGHTDLQMAFFLPLDTPVLAMVAGVVCDVPELYSGDFSVRIAPAGVDCIRAGASVLFETEHVLNPLVKVGDQVQAGDQVATVSDYRRDWKPLGLGVVEIGVFFSQQGDSTPWHACPARFLEPSRAVAMTAALASIHAAWEAERGDPDLYDEAAQSPLGCTTLDDFNA